MNHYSRRSLYFLRSEGVGSAIVNILSELIIKVLSLVKSINQGTKLYFDSTTPVNGESQVTYNIITGGIFIFYNIPDL